MRAIRLGLLATDSLAYQRPALADWRPILGLSTTKCLADWRPAIWPISDRRRSFPLYFQCLDRFFSPLTRARDPNLELTLLTLDQPPGSTGGFAPLAPCMYPNPNATKSPPLRGLRPLPAQTQPTRQTPTRTPYGHQQTIPNYRAAALGGGKMQTVMKPVAVLYPAVFGLRFALTPMAMMKSAHPSPISQTRPLRGRGAKRTLTGAGLTG